ncbi:MAG: hypothetical protein Q9212_007501 [Teloschistes hypoglaucus]
MSKTVTEAFNSIRSLPNFASKFSAAAPEGRRLLPSNKNMDAGYQVRIDAGYYDPSTKGLNVVLQVNSQAKNSALVKWVKRNSTHGKLATATFDTGTNDYNAEGIRVLAELESKAKENLG